MVAIKKYLTMWQVWAAIAVVLGVLLLTRSSSLANILPLSLILICPVMMMFMMGGHKHK